MTELERIAAALERLAPQPLPPPDFAAAEAFVWHTAPDRLDPVAKVSRVDVSLLLGIDRSRDTLMENTRHFARGLPANNALLWGARGMGKSSLVKAIHAAVRAEGHDLKIVELSREDLPSVQRLLTHLRQAPCRFILFCDDLSFSSDDQHYKSLKAVLDGGIEGRPENVLFYATSNRRHLMPRDHNETKGAMAAAEDAEEEVSVSDRFGLWIGFPPMDQPTYLEAVRLYAQRFDLTIKDLDRRALQWSQLRGSRSGRVAWQFIRDLAGELDRDLQG